MLVDRTVIKNCFNVLDISLAPTTAQAKIIVIALAITLVSPTEELKICDVICRYLSCDCENNMFLQQNSQMVKVVGL